MAASATFWTSATLITPSRFKSWFGPARPSASLMISWTSVTLGISAPAILHVKPGTLKVAVTEAGPFIMMEAGFVVPVTLPDQEVNPYGGLAVAVRVTFAPES